MPFWQVSGAVHSLPSSQGVPSSFSAQNPGGVSGTSESESVLPPWSGKRTIGISLPGGSGAGSVSPQPTMTKRSRPPASSLTKVCPQRIRVAPGMVTNLCSVTGPSSSACSGRLTLHLRPTSVTQLALPCKGACFGALARCWCRPDNADIRVVAREKEGTEVIELGLRMHLSELNRGRPVRERIFELIKTA